MFSTFVFRHTIRAPRQVYVRGFAKTPPPPPPPVLPSIAPPEEGGRRRTVLYDIHRRLNAKFVPFAGWDMPVQYQTQGVLTEHLHTRKSCSVFDVSHMGQLKITGKDRVAFLESLVVGDIQNLPQGHSRLSVFTNDKGGIIDDTMITNAGEHLYVVINAGCAEKDIAHLNAKLAAFLEKGGEAAITNFSETNSLIAVQGPHAERLLHKLGTTDLGDMPFMTQKETKVANVPVIITRCGYTGEDGFEISMPHDQVIPIAVTLLEGTTLDEHRIRFAGLGARDSLRLEAALCLYGHELNEDITPIEASLGWLINKRRREEGGFPGADIILNQIKTGVTKKRVGLTFKGAPVREEALIYTTKGEEVGKVTSGTFSPSLKYPIAMAYVKDAHSKPDTKLIVKIRGKDQEATVTKMPFIPHNYKKITTPPTPPTPAPSETPASTDTPATSADTTTAAGTPTAAAGISTPTAGATTPAAGATPTAGTTTPAADTTTTPKQ